jgi:lia operon protein LiaG
MSPFRLHPGGFLLGFVVAAAPIAGAQNDHRSLSGDRVSVYNLAGRVRVQATTGSQVTVDVTRGGRDAGKLRVEAGEIRGWNALRVIFPSDRIVYPEWRSRGRTQMRVNSDGTFDDDRDWRDGDRERVEIRSSGDGLEAHADLTVGVPKGQRVAVHLGVGDATVANVDGDLRVSVSAATVTSEHTRGRLTLDTGSGSVSVTDAQGEVKLDTGSGEVTIDGVQGETLDVDTGSGGVHGHNIDSRMLKVDVGSGGVVLDRITSPRVNVDAGSGRTDLSFAQAVQDLSVDAGSGGVTVRLPAAQGADVDIETGSGGIDSEFPVQTTRLARDHLRGQIGDGRGRIKIESGSGGIRLIKN